MLFLVYALDDPENGAEIRLRTRAAHLRFVAENPEKFRYGGALLDDSGKMLGTLAIIEAPDRPALERFLQADPYNQANLFASVIVTATKQMLPEALPGAFALELARAEQAGAKA